MTGAALNRGSWIVVGLLMTFTIKPVLAVDVTEGSRSFRTFTRDSAVVGENQFRLEVQGLNIHEEPAGLRMRTDDEGNVITQRPARLNLLGYRTDYRSMTGGIFNLMASYGLGKNAELGFVMPFMTDSRMQQNGDTNFQTGAGDFLLYGKYRQSITESFSVSGGLELSTPTGSERKEFGRGDVAVNPFLSTRYHYKALGVGAFVSYDLNSGDAPDVFGYGAEAFLRGGPSYVIRTEVVGRVFHQRGETNHDVTIWPGIDFYISDNFVVRPTALAALTNNIAWDWGVALGISYTLDFGGSAPAAASNTTVAN